MKYAFANFLLFVGAIALLGLVALGCAMLERQIFPQPLPMAIEDTTHHADLPTQNAPLLLPVQLCPAPWAVCVGRECVKPRSRA